MDTISNSETFRRHSESRQVTHITRVCSFADHDMILKGGILLDILTSNMTTPEARILLGIDTMKRAGVEEVQRISLQS
jgi:hypothetical protein